jgi:hypothetical protein
MRKGYRVVIFAVTIAAVAVSIGLALPRASAQAVDLPLATHAWWGSMSDGLQLAIAGGLFHGMAALIRRVS